MAKPLHIALGVSYRLRNGSNVKIDKMLTLGGIKHWQGHWIGTAQRCSWRLDGKYPSVDAPPHELDIVRRA